MDPGNQSSSFFLHQPGRLPEEKTITVVRAKREQLAVCHLFSGDAAHEAEAIGSLVDHFPGVNAVVQLFLTNLK